MLEYGRAGTAAYLFLRQLIRLPGVPVDVLTPNALPDKFRAAVPAEASPVGVGTSNVFRTTQEVAPAMHHATQATPGFKWVAPI